MQCKKEKFKMHKIYNKELKLFRLNPTLSLLRSTILVLSIQPITFSLYFGLNQSLGELLNVWKDHLASEVSGN